MGRLHKLLALLAILPFVASQCTFNRAKVAFKRSVYEFSTDLLRRIAEDTEGHFVASTFSPYTLLSATSLGATDNTLNEMKRVLRQQGHPCFFKKYLELAKLALSTDESATLERSGALFIDDNVGLKDEFRETIRRTGVAEITPLSFADFSLAALQINDFVRSTTHGIIDEIVTASDLDGVYLMMIDAMYFKGMWKKSFDTDNTDQNQFYDSFGNQIGEVNLMLLEDTFNVTKLEPINATVLELPFGKTNRFSMLIFLPDNGVTLNTVIDNLKIISLGSVFGQYRRQGPTEMSVQIPRFKVTSDLANLKELFIDMGLTDMFDPSRAQLTELSDFQLYVSSIVQKADIEVTEEGTTAAAATSMSFTFRSAMTDSEFIANKPFLFMVVDRDIEVPLLTGAYSKPSVY